MLLSVMMIKKKFIIYFITLLASVAICVMFRMMLWFRIIGITFLCAGKIDLHVHSFMFISTNSVQNVNRITTNMLHVAYVTVSIVKNCAD